MGPERGAWQELDLAEEYWSGDAPALERPLATRAVLESLDRRSRRDAVRALRGTLLRTELYARDATPRRDLPYTVVEQMFALREESAPTATEAAGGRRRIFFPHQVASRTTQWERGDDPMTRLQLVAGHDAYGQPTRQTEIGVPRGRDWRTSAVSSAPYLAWHDVTTYAQKDEAGAYMVDRVSSTTRLELENNGTMAASALHASASALTVADLAGSEGSRVLGQTFHYYDGDAFVGLGLGLLGARGALVRSEQLVLTQAILEDAYRSGDTPTNPPEVPPYMVPGGSPVWTSEYPQAFRDQLPALAGYVFRTRRRTSRASSR